MSKNLTRKGLALGAIVALASTVIAGSPAFAAGEVVFAPSTGTSYNTFVTEGLTLNASLAPNQVAGNIAQLKYNVTVPTGATLDYSVNGATAVALAATGTIAGAGSVSAANTLKVSVKYTTGTTAPVATSTSVSVAVVAFIDSNNDNVVDAGEFQQARTIGFKKYSEVVPTVTLTQPNVGDLTVKATATLADINGEQNATDTEVVFTATGQTLTTAGVSPTAAVYSDTVTALAATNVVTARATFKNVALGSAAVSATVAARTISQPTAAVVKSDNAVVSGNVVRTNSAFAVAATVKDVATTPVVKAGVAVKAVVSGLPTLSATKTLSINGTVYVTNASIPASVALTTDAAGVVAVNFVTVGFTASEAVVVTFSAENYSAAVTVDLQDAAYTVVSTSVGSALRSITEGGSTTLNYAVKDQFGVAIGSGARLAVVIAYTTSATVYAAVSAGAASVTVTDTTASTATAITAIATLETQDVSTSNWAAASTPIVAATQTVNVSSVATTFDTVPVVQAIALSTSVALTTSSVTNAGAPVTISSKGVTFTVNSVDYADTVTLFTGTNGDIVVSAKSDIAGAKTITYTAGSETKTAVVTVAAAAENSGAALTLDAPANILPGRTLLVTGKLVDKFGNAVDTTSTATSLVVVYTGPGLLVGALPTSTDADGTFSFRVLLGASETGSATVSATYDTDTTSTTVATLSVQKVITIGAAAVVAPKAAVIATKNGRVYVTVNSPAGFKAYVKVGFSVKPAFTTTGSKLVSYYVGAGKRVAVRVYVRGGIVASQAVTVK